MIQPLTTGWPDPTRPGVPLNPEVDGWHIIDGNPTWWSAASRRWRIEVTTGFMSMQVVGLVAGSTYGGPVRTDADLAAAKSLHEAAGERRERERALHIVNHTRAVLKRCEDAGSHAVPSIVLEYVSNTISALAIPVTSALDALLADAEERGAAKERSKFDRDALRWAQALQQIQQAAAAALEHAPDSELFALLHRTAAGALASDAEPINEAAIRARTPTTGEQADAK